MYVPMIVKKSSGIILLVFSVVVLFSQLADDEKAHGITTNDSIDLVAGRANKVKFKEIRNSLVVRNIKMNEDLTFNEAGSSLEEQTKKHSIDVISWKSFEYTPKVDFRIGHTGNEIWLKFYVSEKYIRALETKTNGDVYKDSCVEFFISLEDGYYYNFEFNCIGTKHVAYGTGRNGREDVDPEFLKRIRIDSSLGAFPFPERKGRCDWELLIAIPISCFPYSDIKSFSDLNTTANFYKCGDHTSVPHYLSWNAIRTERPDFHQPGFFGSVYFE